jgi:large subunit ribosomal protein L11
MAKQITGYLKLQVKGASANPAPPIGPALGSKGLNIMDFCKQFNARTQDKPGQVLPVLITIYNDKSFDFVIKTPPAAVLIMDAAKKQKGSAEPNRIKVGSVTWDQVKKYSTTQDAGPECIQNRVSNENDCGYREEHGYHRFRNCSVGKIKR